MKLKRIEGFDIMVYIVIALVCAIMIYPFLNVIAVSLTSYSEYLKNPMMIFPAKLDLAAFKYVLTNNQVHISYINTIIVTVAGTVIGIALLILTAYPLSKSHLKGRSFFMNLVVFTMMFNGGLVPNYLLIKSLKLNNTLWALILPGLINVHNMLIIKNYYESLPESIEESAKIDGASNITILFKFVMPLSLPVFATIALFIAVALWNDYFGPLLYINSPNLKTLQLYLRDIVTNVADETAKSVDDAMNLPTEGVRSATIIASTVPILCVYPFLQKHFVKGILIGSVKG